jgi:hypothetical protein
MTFDIDSVLVVTRNKEEPIISVGDPALARISSTYMLALHHSANKPAFECRVDRTQPGGCGHLHAVPGCVEPVTTGGMICIKLLNQ